MNDFSIRIHQTRFEHLNGAHFPLILVNEEVELNSSAYLLHRFNIGKTLSTINVDAKAIKKLYTFCLNNDIDIIGRFASLQRLTISEIESLHLFISVKEGTGEIVTQGFFENMWRAILRFIKHIYYFYQSRSNDIHKLNASKVNLDGMIKAFDINSSSPYYGKENERIGLPLDLQLKFFAIISPFEENQLNPFKGEKIRWRNYCFFLSLILAGNRKGESLGLKLRHFNLGGSHQSSKYFEIVREDRTFEGYGKKEIPQVKTRGRKVELSEEMSSIFEHYLTKIRPKFRGHKKSEYVFISLRDGTPLSLTVPNKCIAAIISKHPEFEGKICPHILRNTYHDMLSYGLDESLEGLGAMRKQQLKTTLQEYAGGWASGSNMVAHYPKGAIQKTVAELQVKLQLAMLAKNEGEQDE